MAKAIKINLPTWAQSIDQTYIDRISERLNVFLNEGIDGLERDILVEIQYNKELKKLKDSKLSGLTCTKSDVRECSNMYDRWEGDYCEYEIYLKGKLIGTANMYIADYCFSYEDGSKHELYLGENGIYCDVEDMRDASERGPVANIKFDEGTKITHKDLELFENLQKDYSRYLMPVYKQLFKEAIEKGVEFKNLKTSFVSNGKAHFEEISIDDICPTNFLETLIRAKFYYGRFDVEKAFTESKIYRLEESPTGLIIIADNSNY